ncbi:hypothetical protein ABAC460_15910 [Asticcacaulis sp. AC460]|nr:hypothetical protein ABAC460_15910 [Asticcacaulis sp. AC460]
MFKVFNISRRIHTSQLEALFGKIDSDDMTPHARKIICVPSISAPDIQDSFARKLQNFT